MFDLLFISLSVGFFSLALACTRGCEKLGGGTHG
jgi:hypothetical protein